MEHPLLSEADARVEILRFPYPYSAMLAIVSDIDETSVDDFVNYHRFLNTLEMSVYGPGLGLDVGDSFWMYGPPGRPEVMSWWVGHDEAQVHAAELIRTCIEGGWIDAIHTYGDFQSGRFSRRQAVRSAEELEASGRNVTVWINHGNENNRQNFPGAYRLAHYMEGDVPASPAYHADITLPELGIRFFQSHDVSDFGSPFPLAPYALRDGQKIWGFVRTSRREQSLVEAGLGVLSSRVVETLSRRGVRQPKTFPFKPWLWHTNHLDEQLSSDRLRQLVREKNFALIGQHLGSRGPLPTRAVRALRRLKEFSDSGEILVARTSRLLNYAVTREHLEFSVDQKGEIVRVGQILDPVSGPRSPSLDDLRGITFGGPGVQNFRILYGDEPSPIPERELDRGRGRVGIRWFRPDTRDFSSMSTQS